MGSSLLQVAKLHSFTTFLSSLVVACYFLNQVVFPVVKLLLDPSSDVASIKSYKLLKYSVSF